MTDLTRRISARLSRFDGLRRLLKLYRMARFRWRRRGMTPQEIFTQHYETNWWKSPESRSGGGSTLAYTENVRKELPGLLARLGVKRFLDAPCGDFNWFQHVAMPEGVHYLGGDVVAPMIEANRAKYASATREFRLLDITKDPLPPVDLWMCRAVLIHFANQEIWATLANFLRSDIRWLLTTSLPGSRDNRDIVTGHVRPLNLQHPPFDLGPAQAEIDDWVEGWPVNKLYLWNRETLAARLAANPHFQRHQREAARRSAGGL